MTETEILFTELLDCRRSSLYLNKDMPLSKDKALFVSSVLKKRILAEPIEYILGKTEFMGLEFKVNKDVFIPRQETEILVEITLEIRNKVYAPGSIIDILDLCAGSGCVAVSLAKFIEDARITAVDISQRALAAAKENAVLNKAADRMKFIEADLFISRKLQITAYDIIVSNPPYIPTTVIERLPAEVKYEPRIALDGGQDGLDFYRRIIKEATAYLKENGLLIMEMGYNQREDIENIFRKSGKFEMIEVVKDYSGIDRVIVTRKYG